MSTKSFKIVAVRPILGIDKPIIVLEVQGGQAIVRNPKQALTDLQNSGLALDIDAKEFAYGIERVSQYTKAEFLEGLYDLVGDTVTGDITDVKAGDSYVVTGNHPALVDPNHPFYNKVKDGETLKAEKDGQWVTGFLSFSPSMEKRMMKSDSREYAKLRMKQFGFSNAVSAPVATATVTEDIPETQELPTASAEEAFATTGKQEKAK